MGSIAKKKYKENLPGAVVSLDYLLGFKEVDANKKRFVRTKEEQE